MTAAANRSFPLRTVLSLALFAALGTAWAQSEPAKIDPLGGGTTEAPAARADLSEANERIRAGEYEEADRILAALLPEFPDDPALLLMRGEVLLAVGRPDEAVEILRHGAEVDPKRPRVHFQLATALASTGQPEEALEAFEKELGVNTDSQVLVLARLNRSMLFQRSRDWAGAAGELEAVLALDPASVNVYGDLATLYIQSGRIDEAVDALQRGKAAGYDSSEHYYSLGARLYNTGRYDDAVTMLGEAIRVDPELAEAERTLAAALERLGRDEEALMHLRRYVELRPEAPDAEAALRKIREASSR